MRVKWCWWKGGHTGAHRRTAWCKGTLYAVYYISSTGRHIHLHKNTNNMLPKKHIIKYTVQYTHWWKGGHPGQSRGKMGLGRRLRSTDKTHSSDSKNRSHKYTKKVTQIYKKKTFRTLPSQQSQCFPQWLSSIHVLQPGVKNIIIRVEKRKQWQTTLSEETVGFYQLCSSNVSESCLTSLCLCL